MSLILGAGIGAGVYALKERITEPKVPGIEVSVPEEVGGGVILNKPENHGIEMVSTKISREEYAEYGVSPMAENAYTLTATIEPANASNKAVDWSVEFVDAGDEWASGKSVTDYVTVTPTSDGALTATVTNLGEFGAQIKVTVTSRDNSAAYASCTVDYAKRIKSAYLVDGSGAPIGQNGEDWVTGLHDNFTETYIPQYMVYTVNYTYSEYTVEDTFTMTASAQLNADFESGLRAYAEEHQSDGGDEMGAAQVLKYLSTEEKNPIETANLWYYTASASGFLSLFYSNYSAVPDSVKVSALNMLADYVKSLSSGKTDAVEYEVTFTGTHSTYTLQFTQVLNGAEMTHAVTGVELNENNIIL